MSNAGSNQCFNRSYSQRAAHGDGVYFARDASYSASPTYSKPDGGTGVQRMYLSRVVVGRYTNGRSGMKDAPERDPATHTLFDSVDSYRRCAAAIRAAIPGARFGASNWVEVVGGSGNLTANKSASDWFQAEFYVRL